MSALRKLKPKLCRNAECREEFNPRMSTQVACSLACALAVVKATNEKKLAKQKRDAEIAQKRKDTGWKRRNRLKSKVLSNTQKAVNDYIRLRDSAKPCISCGGTVAEIEAAQGWKTGGAWDAGHFRSRGSASQLRFNFLNIHKQCKSCNLGSGKFGHNHGIRETVDAAYETGLIERIGAERVRALKEDRRKRSYHADYLDRLAGICRRRIKLYKKLRGL